jgi:hypothetical protein
VGHFHIVGVWVGHRGWRSTPGRAGPSDNRPATAPSPSRSSMVKAATMEGFSVAPAYRLKEKR